MPAVEFFGRAAAPTHQRLGQRVVQSRLHGGGRGVGAFQRVGFRHKRQRKEVRGVNAEQAVRVARSPFRGCPPGRIRMMSEGSVGLPDLEDAVTASSEASLPWSPWLASPGLMR